MVKNKFEYNSPPKGVPKQIKHNNRVYSFVVPIGDRYGGEEAAKNFADSINRCGYTTIIRKFKNQDCRFGVYIGPKSKVKRKTTTIVVDKNILETIKHSLDKSTDQIYDFEELSYTYGDNIQLREIVENALKRVR